MKDFLDQLAELEMRDPPPEFDRRLHERLNRWLIAQQVFDLFLGAIPWAIVHFLAAVVGFVRFSVTGKFDRPQRPDSESDSVGN